MTFHTFQKRRLAEAESSGFPRELNLDLQGLFNDKSGKVFGRYTDPEMPGFYVDIPEDWL